MSEDLAKEISELKRRLAELEAKQSAQEPPRPRMNMPKIDYTENFRLPADAAQKMAAVVPDVKGQKFDPSAWARNSYPQPGGFGPPPGPSGAREVQRGSGWYKPPDHFKDHAEKFERIARLEAQRKKAQGEG